MFGRMMDFLSKDMAMDLGTANTLIYVKGKGVVLDEPSMVAIEKDSGQIIAVGREAKNLAGRHTRGTTVTRPMRDGVIYDFETASFMVRSFLGKVFRRFPLTKPKLVVAVPAGITSVEKRAVVEAAQIAGAGKVFLIEEPMAAAIGTDLPIDQPAGQMVVDIGGGTTEVAIISQFAVSCSESLRVAGDEANAAICRFIRQQHSVGISEMMAEVIKMKIGSAVPLKKTLEVKFRGKDLVSAMPKIITVTDADIRLAMKEPTQAIIVAILRVLEKASPDLVSDIAENGIWLAGGGSLLKRTSSADSPGCGNRCAEIRRPASSGNSGAGSVTEHFDYYRDVFLN